MKKRLFTRLVLLLGLAALLSGCGASKMTEEDLLASIPTLTLWIGDQSTSIPTYGYSWTYVVGDEGQSVIADTAHPLQVVEDLTRVSAPAGSTVEMDFSLLPDSVTITYWTADQAGSAPPDAEGETLESFFSNGQFLFTAPERDQDLVVMVRGKWTGYQDVSGSVSYAFVLPQN